MAIGRPFVSGLDSRVRTGSRQFVALIIAAAAGLGLGLLLTGLGHTVTAMITIAGVAVGVAVLSPYWALVIGVAQWAFLPPEGEFFGVQTPDQLQFLAPLLIISALLGSLKECAHDRLSLKFPDIAVGSIALWGLLGFMIARDGGYKWYVVRMMLPMAFYYAVRLTSLNRQEFLRLMVIMPCAVILQSLLMIRESAVGSSFIYGSYNVSMDGVKPSVGPFLYHWSATTFLALWPALLVYMIHRANTSRTKLLWAMGLLLVLVANTRTMERSGIAASLLGIAFCLVSPRLRRTATIVLATIAVAFVPWSISRSGGALMDRFDETDQSRAAYRTAAINLMKSSEWNPLYGVGWSSAGPHLGRFGTDELVIAFGHKKATVAEVAAGSKIHNVWLALPVEMGLVGVVLALAIVTSALIASVRIIRRARERPVDTALITAIWGGLLALAAIGYYQNIWHYPASMSLLWLFYAVIVAKPHVFEIERSECADDS